MLAFRVVLFLEKERPTARALRASDEGLQAWAEARHLSPFAVSELVTLRGQWSQEQHTGLLAGNN